MDPRRRRASQLLFLPQTNWTIRDILGRTHKTIENYDDGQVGNTDNEVDRTTIYGYDVKGRLITMTAKNPKGTYVEDQVTTCVYDPQAFLVAPDNHRQDMVWAVIYPDSTATYNPNAAPGSRIAGPDHVRFTYDRQGRRTTARDQRGVEHTYTFDLADRLQADKVTAWDNPGNTDQTIKAITYAYDSQSRLTKITSHGNATDNPADTTDVQNQIAYACDDGPGNTGWGSLKTSWQSHTGVVTTTGPGESPKVDYAYADDVASNQARFVRRTKITYPNGREVQYNYGVAGSINDRLSRLEAFVDGSATIASYAYNGIDQMVKKDYPIPQVRLVPGRDRFNRVIAQTWQDYSNPSAPVATQDIRHGYDLASNQIYADNKVYESASQYYLYDVLDRLVNTKVGELTRDPNQIPTGIALGNIQREQGWTLESLGNTTVFKDHGIANWRQSTFNKANEIATQQIDGQPPVNVQHDDAGNLIYDGTYTYTYDAWNRQIQVKRNGNVVSTSSYDSLGRRVKKEITNSGDQDYTYLYHYNGWRVIKERNGTNQPLKTYVWGNQYVDELVQIQAHIGDVTGAAYWAMQDANYNVLGVMNSAGTMVERYEYTPYGERITYSGGPDPLLPTPANPVRLGSLIPVTLNDFGHQGLMHDLTTGLIYNRARMYSSDQQIFLQRDPLGYSDSANLYQYVHSNPIRYVDPMGLAGEEKGPCAKGIRHGEYCLEVITDSNGYWQVQKTYTPEGKRISTQRVVKNCHVLIVYDHANVLMDVRNGPFAAGDSSWQNMRLKPEPHYLTTEQTMSAFGALTCWGDFVNYSHDIIVSENYVPGSGRDDSRKEVVRERPGVITGFPRIKAPVGPGYDENGEGYHNGGYGEGPEGYIKLRNAAWEKGKAQAKLMAKDCKCECDEIKLVFVAASKEAEKKMIADGKALKIKNFKPFMTETFKCEKGKKRTGR